MADEKKYYRPTTDYCYYNVWPREFDEKNTQILKRKIQKIRNNSEDVKHIIQHRKEDTQFAMLKIWTAIILDNRNVGAEIGEAFLNAVSVGYLFSGENTKTIYADIYDIYEDMVDTRFPLLDEDDRKDLNFNFPIITQDFREYYLIAMEGIERILSDQRARSVEENYLAEILTPDGFWRFSKKRKRSSPKKKRSKRKKRSGHKKSRKSPKRKSR